MNVRKLKPLDLPALVDIFKRAYAEEDWSDDGALGYLTKFYEFEPNSCYAIEEPDGTLSAALLAYSYYRAERLILFLQELFVDPDRRHQGHASKLVETVRKSFVDSPQVNVVPLVKADTAILNFYQSLGFERAPVFSFIDDDF